MRELVPYLSLVSGSVLLLLLQNKTVQEKWSELHPFNKPISKAKKAAWIMVVAGGLWTVQILVVA